jgi:PAS domain S-box-containing protein
MPNWSPRPNRLGRPARWTAACLISFAWLLVVAISVAKLRQADGIVIAVAGLVAAAITFGVLAWSELVRWRNPVNGVTRFVRELRQTRKARPPDAFAPEVAELTREIVALAKSIRRLTPTRRPSLPRPTKQPPAIQPAPSDASLTRSGLLDAPRPEQGDHADPTMSGDYSTADMVNRLEPVAFRWIDSSTAEQILLGWTVEELRQRSFLDVVHPDDRPRTEKAFALALDRGEAMGLIVRMRTAHGETRAIEVNVGARYGTNQKVTHLRCHLTDVTDKVRAERELRLRTRELTQVNDQLRRINRELEELKDRYGDLYENAPAMYFSLDTQAIVIECNQTMLSTLKRTRDQVVGRSYESFIHAPLVDRFRARFTEFLQRGFVEKETCWVKSNGELMDVWIVGTVTPSSRGAGIQARFVAQDVTAKRLLEAELSGTNQSLARANEELSQRNRELDEFVYVVSHDLQEPLRTLIAFSDFLLRDCGERLEPEGQEHVRYLVDASRRMRAMIHGLLHLSRVGKVIDEFTCVDLNELVAVIRTDLGELFRCKHGELRIIGPLPPVWGDHDRIGQLLANLIANGLKYNVDSKPWVEVKAVGGTGVGSPNVHDDSGDDVIISIRDNGIGIEPRFHETIFQLFRRLHTREEHEGTGVGLAICNKIVQAHGGRIWVESTLGQGATFFVRLRSGMSQSTVSSSHTVASSPYEPAVSQVLVDEPNAN